MKLNFSKHPEAQDMISIIMHDKGMSIVEAIDFAINEENYQSIVKTGWASIALPLWGHADPEREWDSLEESCLEIELEESKRDLVNKIVKKERVNVTTAVSYFLLFTMDSLGYHI